MSLQVLTIPYYKDNYGYYIYNKSWPSKDGGIFVDCGQFSKVYQFFKSFNLKPSCLLTTHKHWDHSGGNQQLRAQYPQIQIVGSQSDKIPSATKLVKNGDIFQVAGMSVEAFHTPCHTRGHMLYYVKPAADDGKEEEVKELKQFDHKNEMIQGKKYMLTSQLKHVIFTGDTVFIGGCGRFFEGEPFEMYNAFKLLNSLPDDVRVFCGHEYSIQNLEFCLKVQDKNTITANKLKQFKQLRQNGHFTVPSTVKLERDINVFMRNQEPSVYNFFGRGKKDGIKVMQMLRQFKNTGKKPKL